MTKLEEINDPKTLQQVAVLLEKSIIKLQKENTKLRCENARLRGETIDPQMELGFLKEQLAAMQRSLFAASSEKRPAENTEETAATPKTLGTVDHNFTTQQAHNGRMPNSFWAGPRRDQITSSELPAF